MKMRTGMLIVAAIVLLGGLLLLASVPGARASAPALGVHSIGYLGCSNTRDSVSGYETTAGNRNLFWNPAYFDTGGGTIEQWANSASSYWTKFGDQLRIYGQPAVVWVQLCENYPKTQNTYTEVQQLFTILKQRVPSGAFYLSAINIYNPSTLCSFMGPNGQGETDTVKWRDQAVAAGLALRGPDMGLLTATTTTFDGCHPNTAGESLLGTELFSFFDAGIPPNSTGTPTATRIATGTRTSTPARTLTRTATATPVPCRVKPSAPMLALPTNGSIVTTIQVPLKWAKATCASYYNATVRLNSASGAIVDQANNLQAVQFTTLALVPGRIYFWSVTACNSVGCTASPSWSFGLN